MVGTLLTLIGLIAIKNCNFASNEGRQTAPLLLAHRGLAQTFDIKTVRWNTNTAKIIHPPEHDYIENTIPSIKAAFDYGADMVEFDIKVTRDKQLVLFHDYVIDYRTEGHGKVSDFTMEELQRLDVGYGYTSDDGQSYPFRGKGVGLIPSIDEVFATFPDRSFLIHIKDTGGEIGNLLLHKLNQLPKKALERISIYGNDGALTTIKHQFPQIKALSKKIIKKALLNYELIGWSGVIPESIKNIQLHLPIQYAKYLWGWPEIFLKRMKSVNTRVVLVNMQGQWSGGFDNENDFAQLPQGYCEYIWTDRIDVVSSLVKSTNKNQ